MRDLRDDEMKIWNIEKNIPMKESAWTITPVISSLVKCPALSSDIITDHPPHWSSIREIFPSFFTLSGHHWLYWWNKTGEPFILAPVVGIYILLETLHYFIASDLNTNWMITEGTTFNICWATIEGVVYVIIVIQDQALSYNCPQISPKYIFIDKIIISTERGSGTGVVTYDNDTIILIFILWASSQSVGVKITRK